LLVSTIELDAPDRPYAVDTVARLQDETRRLFFIIGADSWAEITTWKEWQRLVGMCDLIVVTRPGYLVEAKVDNFIDVRGFDQSTIVSLTRSEVELRVFVTDVAMTDVAARSIRTAVSTNDLEKLNQDVPPAVAAYIEKNGLYRN